MAQNPPSNQNSNLNEGIINKFLDVQKREMDVREMEMSLRKQEQDNSFKLAQESLRQQGEYMKSAPHHFFKYRIMWLLFILLIIGGIGYFLLYCIAHGKDDIAREIIKYGSTAVFSGGAGFFWGKSKAPKQKESKVEVVEGED